MNDNVKNVYKVIQKIDKIDDFLDFLYNECINAGSPYEAYKVFLEKIYNVLGDVYKHIMKFDNGQYKFSSYTSKFLTKYNNLEGVPENTFKKISGLNPADITVKILQGIQDANIKGRIDSVNIEDIIKNAIGGAKITDEITAAIAAADIKNQFQPK